MSASIIEKIIALRQMTEQNGATKEEAESFAQKAAKLMAEHAIAENELEGKKSEHELETYKIKYLNPWRRTLIHIIAHACFCEMVCGGGETVHLVGRPLNVRAAREMFPFIERQVVLIARQLFPRDRKAQRRAEGGLGIGVAKKINASNLLNSERYLPVVQEMDAARSAAESMLRLKRARWRSHRLSYEHRMGEANANRIQIREEISPQG